MFVENMRFHGLPLLGLGRNIGRESEGKRSNTFFSFVVWQAYMRTPPQSLQFASPHLKQPDAMLHPVTALWTLPPGARPRASKPSQHMEKHDRDPHLTKPVDFLWGTACLVWNSFYRQSNYPGSGFQKLLQKPLRTLRSSAFIVGGEFVWCSEKRTRP